METIIRNVSDLPANDRTAAERLVGHELALNQQLVIVVTNQVATGQSGKGVSAGSFPTPKLPDWCNVYGGLSDKEVSDVEATILNRADLSRVSE